MSLGAFAPAGRGERRSGFPGRALGKSEYILVGGLVFLGAVSLPLVKDVYLIQSIVLAVCGGLGFQ